MRKKNTIIHCLRSCNVHFLKNIVLLSFYCTWHALSSLRVQIALTQFSFSGVSSKISIHCSTRENEVVQHRLQQQAVNRNDEIRKVEK